MANRADQFDPPDFIGNDEIDALFGAANPNRDRVGCPSKEVLSALARRERAMDDPTYEHLTRCSPCYREFRVLQATSAARVSESRQPARARWFAPIAASLLLLLTAGVWLYFGARGTPEALVELPIVAGNHVQLDLRPYTVARSEQGPGSPPPLSLAAQRLNLTILLPTGSEPGAYDLRLLDAASRPVASGSGLAVIRNFVTTLEVGIDLSSAPAGDYRLSVRRQGEEWTFYPALVK